MLADKDRIFTNLYGQEDWRLAGARRRSDWDGLPGFGLLESRIKTCHHKRRHYILCLVEVPMASRQAGVHQWRDANAQIWIALDRFLGN